MQKKQNYPRYSDFIDEISRKLLPAPIIMLGPRMYPVDPFIKDLSEDTLAILGLASGSSLNSQGEIQRGMIAELLSMEFSGVALDEALSGIPVSLETDIIRYLATENKHIIYISHRENPSIDSMADIALRLT